MVLNYLKIAWRNLLRHKLYSIINTIGLSIGLTCALFIIFHVKEELSYEVNFPKADRIFRITDQGFGEKARHWAATPPVVATEISQFIPEIENAGRLYYANVRVLRYEPATGPRKSFEEQEGYYADAAMAHIFDLQFLKGNPQLALREVNAIVLTEATARKYFGPENPLGKTLVDEYDKRSLKVTGVIKNMPGTTHLQFDYLLSMPTLYRIMDKGSLTNRTWNGFYTYVLLRQTATRLAAEKKMVDFTARFYAAPDITRAEILASGIFRLQPITDIHLHSKLEKELGPNSSMVYVYIFGTAALFILLIAGINFINIATAQAFKRLKEVGVRKVLGAFRQQLIGQFLAESLFLTVFSALLAVVLFYFVLPFYNSLAGKQLTAPEVFTPANILFISGAVVGFGLLTGLYPAFFVSRFNPLHALKGRSKAGPAIPFLRQGLIVFQFVISVFMIVCTLVIYRQMELFRNSNLGFDKEQVVAVKLYGDLQQKVVANAPAFKSELLSNPAIAGAALVSRLPGERLGMEPLELKGIAAGEDTPNLRYMWADEDLLNTLNISLAAGKNFLKSTSDSTTAFILNEAAVTILGLKDPIGQTATSGNTGEAGPIVGVTKDFNFASLHTLVEPLVIQYKPANAGYLLVKIKGDQIPATLQFLEKKITALVPNSLFRYSFLADNLDQLYVAENRVSHIFKVFAGFTVFISCLGLFGLSAYAAEVRRKEIGIRKVLGASVGGVVNMLSRDFLKLVLLANIIAWPLAWWAMHKWLQDFSYRINISLWLFALAGLGALFIALLTVSFQAIKAAVANPVEALRNE